MRNTQKFIFCLGIACALVSGSCRKGEEDPAISFKSRKSRVSGEWHMKSGYVAYTLNLSNPPLKYNETWTFKGTGFTFNSTKSASGSFSGAYILNLTVRKDRTFEFDELLRGETLKCKGTWSFTKGKGEEKNKEGIVFSITETTKGSTLNGFFNQRATDFRFNIQRLASKELKLRAIGNEALAEGKQSIATITDYTFETDEN